MGQWDREDSLKGRRREMSEHPPRAPSPQVLLAQAAQPDPTPQPCVLCFGAPTSQMLHLGSSDQLLTSALPAPPALPLPEPLPTPTPRQAQREVQSGQSVPGSGSSLGESL